MGSGFSFEGGLGEFLMLGFPGFGSFGLNACVIGKSKRIILFPFFDLLKLILRSRLIHP